jgi:hypothetical protein
MEMEGVQEANGRGQGQEWKESRNGIERVRMIWKR